MVLVLLLFVGLKLPVEPVTVDGAVRTYCGLNLQTLSPKRINEINSRRPYTQQAHKSLRAHAIAGMIKEILKAGKVPAIKDSQEYLFLPRDKLRAIGLYSANERLAERALFESSTEFFLNILTNLKRDPSFEKLDEATRFHIEDDLLLQAALGNAPSKELDEFHKNFRRQRLLDVAKASIIQDGVVLRLEDLSELAFKKTKATFFHGEIKYSSGAEVTFEIRNFWQVLLDALIDDPDFGNLSEAQQESAIETIERRISRFE